MSELSLYTCAWLVCVGTPSFRELVARVRTTVRDALANADVPYAVVVQDAGVARSVAYNPVFQNMCVLQDAAFFSLPSLEGAAAEAMKVRGRATPCRHAPRQAACGSVMSLARRLQLSAM